MNTNPNKIFYLAKLSCHMMYMHVDLYVCAQNVKATWNLRSFRVNLFLYLVRKLIDSEIEGGSCERQSLGEGRAKDGFCAKKATVSVPKASKQSDVTFLEALLSYFPSFPFSFAHSMKLFLFNFQMDFYRNGVDHLYLICFPFIMFTLHILRAKIKVDEFSAYLWVL